jgi:hypothetical protein
MSHILAVKSDDPVKNIFASFSKRAMHITSAVCSLYLAKYLCGLSKSQRQTVESVEPEIRKFPFKNLQHCIAPVWPTNSCIGLFLLISFSFFLTRVLSSKTSNLASSVPQTTFFPSVFSKSTDISQVLDASILVSILFVAASQ